MKKLILYWNISFLLVVSIGYTQTTFSQEELPINTGARYYSGADGIIRMYVNVWGHVGTPGRILVDEGIDLAVLLSLTGGPKKGAKLKNIIVYHEYPDKTGLTVHNIDFTEFLETGDRSKFITIQPNDTFIIKQTKWSFFIEQIGTINILMSLVNIYLNLNNIVSG